MNEFFKSLHSFLQSAEQQAADAAKKGANVLRSWADYIDKIASGEMLADDVDDAELASCEKKCKELMATPVGASGPGEKKIDPATIMLILQLVTTIIEAIRKRRNPQTA